MTGIDWLRKNIEFLSLNKMNKKLNKTHGLPNSSLYKHVTGRQELADKWHPCVEDFVNKLRNEE